MTPTRTDLANAIRALSMDAVQKANSGHPGMPMGMADIAEVLWNDFISHNPSNPEWANRDRVVLSNGHGSMLLYSVLHLSGYDLPVSELANFRQMGSKTPGHPEYGYTPGVETTTGPLGQGIANAVGFAMAEKMLAATYNTPDYSVIDHHTYVLLGDGCLMEGISHEACSLAGVYKLGKLVAIYDDNGISIDGNVAGWFRDDTPARFEAYGWHVVRDVDGHNPDALKAAIAEAKSVTDKPTIICAKTVIGFGSPNKAGTAGCHGAALGDDEIKLTREKIGWPHAPFEVPSEIYAAWDAKEAGAAAESSWNTLFAEYCDKFPEKGSELKRRLSGELPEGWSQTIGDYIGKLASEGTKVASRKASGNTLDVIGPALPELFGGSADLTGSNLTRWADASVCNDGQLEGSNYICYGVREFGMTAIMNGITLHGGFIPFGGTFLVFSDYARNAVRLASLMGVRSIQVYTHDSIGLGEDGPTHQPIEHLGSLRAMPNLYVWRPCDDLETAVSWKVSIETTTGPSCLVLSRQGLVHQARSAEQVAQAERGGYILHEPAQSAQAIVIATGSEVELAMEAARQLEGQIAVRVVSMPCAEVFDKQDDEYKASVLPSAITARVAVEAGQPDCWYKYVGLNGKVIGMEGYGESAPAELLFEHFGITANNVADSVKSLVK